MERTFKYKFRLNRQFQTACEETLESCRFLYNCALEQRIAHHKQGQDIRLFAQLRQLTDARELPEVGKQLRGFQVDVIRRLDKAYQSFFRRLKTRNGKAGFPRFKGFYRYDSFRTIDSRAFKLRCDKLYIQKLGSCRLRLSRPLLGKPKTLTIRRDVDGWYAIITCTEVPSRPLPVTTDAVGIDVGIESLATLSTGETIPNPRFYQSGQELLARTQQRLALKTKGSESRKRARRLVAKACAKVKRQRDWFHWVASNEIVKQFGIVAVENLNVKGLAQGNLAKQIHDVGWASFIDKLTSKVEETGRKLVKVSARFTSQDCSVCGRREKKPLSVRWHSCPCGAELSRDHNAAINILGRDGPDLKIEPTTSL